MAKKEKLGPAQLVEDPVSDDLGEGEAIDRVLQCAHDLIRETVDLVATELDWGEKHISANMILAIAEEIEDLCEKMHKKEESEEGS